LAWQILAVVCLSGCGGGDEEEVASQQEPQNLVPVVAADSAQVDTVVASESESVYQAGTLTVSEGVSEESSAAEPPAGEVVEEIKAVPAAEETPPASVPRPNTSVSSGDGSYSLQLGSFTSLENARGQVERISALGYAPVIEESNLGGQVYHRVMLRDVGDMAEASRLGEYIHSELGIAYLVRRGK
jgi:cell division septation protein DedD